jgi:hypothetical protein
LICRERAFPVVLLVDDKVKVVELVLGRTPFFPGFLWKNAVKFCEDHVA